ncbi:hypothetical protein K8I61_17360 [bacterium]|nr:hypothetical protein [bacterium]
MQKAIRRGDAPVAGYFAVELFESGFIHYVWKRLLTISAEDCFGVITQEIESLHRAHQFVTQDGKKKTRVFLGKAVILLCQAPKCRDADHLTNLIYDRRIDMSDEQIEAALQDARENTVPIPDYAYDVHTSRGRGRGMTKEDFFREEFEALSPREKGLLDNSVAKVVKPQGELFAR